LSAEQSAFCAERFGRVLALLGYESSRDEHAVAADASIRLAVPRRASPVL